jgi:hypothetical protein
MIIVVTVYDFYFKTAAFFLWNRNYQVCETEFIALVSTVYDQPSGEHGGLHESLNVAGGCDGLSL